MFLEALWLDISELLFPKVPQLQKFHQKDIINGLILESEKDDFFLVKVILVLGKVDLLCILPSS